MAHMNYDQCAVDYRPNTRGGMEHFCEPVGFVFNFYDRLRRIKPQKNGNPTPVWVHLRHEAVLAVVCSVGKRLCKTVGKAQVHVPVSHGFPPILQTSGRLEKLRLLKRHPILSMFIRRKAPRHAMLPQHSLVHNPMPICSLRSILKLQLIFPPPLLPVEPPVASPAWT